MESKVIVAVVVGVAAFILLAASAGGAVWTKTASTSIGIFRYCYNTLAGNTKCDNYSLDVMKNSHDKINAVRAFAILGVLSSMFGVIFALVRLCSSKVKGVVGGVFFIIAGICALIAASIYTDNTREVVEKTNGLDYGWSFIFQWVGMIVVFVAAVLSIISN